MYDTELMRKILTSPMARKMIQQIAPRYGNAYTFLHLMNVTGKEWDEIEWWIDEIKKQTVPQTATWGLIYWEMQYNIIPNTDWTYERRREQVIAKRNRKGPMNPRRIERIASIASGVKARVEENTGKNRFTLYLEATPDMVDETAVRNAVDKAKSPRLHYNIAYERYIKGTAYTAGVFRYEKEITLKQV